jgi:hypothetical protein
MALKHKCTLCNKEFEAPNYECRTGTYHTVAQKTYYSKADSMLVMWKTDKTLYDHSGGGRVVQMPGKNAKFVRGVFQTADPEEQDFFDTFNDLCTYEEWEQARFSSEELLAKKQRELEAAKRAVEETNELLKKLQAEAATKTTKVTANA